MTTFFPELVPENGGPSRQAKEESSKFKISQLLDLPKVAKSWVFAAFLFGTEEAKVAK